MLESLLTTLFNKYLGPYVENLDGSQLRLSLFTGSLTLKDVAIKPDALSSLFDLPVRILAGKIGSINVSIPLSALRSKPTVITLDQIYLFVAPWFAGKSVASNVVAAAIAKNVLLATIEQHYIAAKLSSGVPKPSDTGSPADADNKLFEGLVGTIVANLQVRITRVHIRYEHPLTLVPQPRGLDSVRSVILGLSIAELAISTCNEKWEVEFVRRPGDTVYKLGSVQGVAIYLDAALQPQVSSVLALLDSDAAASFSKSNPRNANSHSARTAAALRSRALGSFSHIFDAQTALGQISVAFEPPPRTTNGSGNERSMFEGRSGGSEFSRRSGGDGRSFADAYCYILKPVSLTVRLVMPVANPLDKAKVEATVAVDPIELFLADRQYALLMRVLGEHSDAWEARNLGLRYQSIMIFDEDEGVDSRSSGTSETDDSAPDSDADSDDDAADLKEIGRARGGISALKPRVAPSRTKISAPAALPSRPKFASKHRAAWVRVCHALVMRRRATLREVERHRFLASIAVEYMQLYLRRLKATELQGLPPLSQAERKRYEGIQCDLRLSAADVLALRRAAERWAGEQLRLPMADMQSRRDEEVLFYSRKFELASNKADPSSAATGAGSKGAASSSTATSRQTSGGGRNVSRADRQPVPKDSPTDIPAKPKGGFLGRFFKVDRVSSSPSVDSPSVASQKQLAGAGRDRKGTSDAQSSLELSSDDMVALYSSLGFEFDPETGSTVVARGVDSSTDASVIANSGLPLTYTWLRLRIELRSVMLALQEHQLHVASSGGGGAPRGLLHTLASALPGSLAAMGTVHPVACLRVSRSTLGCDMQSSSWSMGVDLGDIAVIDCSQHVAPRSQPAAGRSRRAGAAAKLAHRYVLFSDHSSANDLAAELALATGLARGLVRGVSNAASASKFGDSDAFEGVTESGICDEPVSTAALGAGASTATSRRMSSRRFGASPEQPLIGGGRLTANPVRSGWLSLRLVNNPGISAQQLGGETPATASSSSKEASQSSVWLKARLIARPLVAVWSPPLLRRILAWAETADSAASAEHGGSTASPAVAVAGADSANAVRSTIGSASGRAFAMLQRYLAASFLTASTFIESALLSSRDKTDVRVLFAAPVLVVPQRMHMHPADRPPTRAVANPAEMRQLMQAATSMLVVDMGSIALVTRPVVASSAVPPPLSFGSSQSADMHAASASDSSSSTSGVVWDPWLTSYGAALASIAPADSAHDLFSLVSGATTSGSGSLFDLYCLKASGLSVLLCKRALLDNSEDFESSLHSRDAGTSDLVIVQGAPEEDATSTPASPIVSRARGRTDATSAVPPGLHTSGSREWDRDKSESVFDFSDLGPPRIAWFRRSVRPVVRRCTLTADFYVNVSAEDFFVQQPGVSIPLPPVFARLHLDQLTLALSTNDIVDLTNVAFASTAALMASDALPQGSLDTSKQQQAGQKTGSSTSQVPFTSSGEMTVFAAGMLLQRRTGVEVDIVTPFNALPRSSFELADILALLAAAEASGRMMRRTEPRVEPRLRRGQNASSADRFVSEQVAAAVSASASLTNPSIRHEMVLQASVGALTLRLSHQQSSEQLGAADASHTPFDLVLSAERFRIDAISTDLGMSVRGELASVLAYIGAGFVPRALLLQLRGHIYAAAGVPSLAAPQPGILATSGRGSSNQSLESSAGAASQPRAKVVPLEPFSAHVEIVGAELSLVRRQQHQLELVDAEIGRAADAAAAGANSRRKRGRGHYGSAVLGAHATYAAVINELKSDATYLCTPVHAHVALATLTPVVPAFEAESSVLPPARMRTLLRVGSAALSVSPSDAALLVALVQAVQAGSASVLQRIAGGFAQYMLVRPTGDDESGAADTLDDSADVSDSDSNTDRAVETPVEDGGDPNAAQAALAAAQSGLRRAAGDRVQRAAAFVMAAAAEAANVAAISESSVASGDNQAVDTRSAMRILNDALAPMEVANASANTFEFRVLCDKLQITLYNNCLAGSVASGGGRQRGSTPGARGIDSTESGLPTYRVQVLRVTLQHFGVCIAPSSVSLMGFLGAYYFNDAVSTWEPALESWPFLLTIGVVAVPGNRLGELADSTAAVPAALEVTLKGVDSLNLTASAALFAAVPTIQEAIDDVLSAIKQQPADVALPAQPSLAVSVGRPRADSATSGQDVGAGVSGHRPAALAFAPFVLFNETGCTMQIWRPEQRGVDAGFARSDAPPLPAIVFSGDELPVSATYLALMDQDALAAAAMFDTRASSSAGGVGSNLRRPSNAVGVGAAMAMTAALDVSAPAQVPQLERPVPPLDDAEDVVEDENPDIFQLGAFARLAKDEQTAWYKTFDDGMPTHVLSGTVAVTINMQFAGYQPLLRQPINRTGATHIVLMPLESGQNRTHEGVDLLPAGEMDVPHTVRVTQDDLGALHEEGSLHAASGDAGRAGGAALSGWRRIVSESRLSGAVWPLHVELFVERSAGGAKLLRARSLVHVHNSTRIPVVVRMVPSAAPYFLRRCGTHDHAAVPFDSAEFCGALDRTTVLLAQQLHGAACDEAAGRLAAAAARVKRASQVLSTPAENSSAASKQLFSAQPRVAGGLGLSSATTNALASVSTSGHHLRSERSIPASFNFSCWDAASGGLPLDRVVPPGRSWRVPVPYAENSRLFFRPALLLPAAAPGLQLLTVASGADDGHVTLWPPVEALSAVSSSLPGSFQGTKPATAPPVHRMLASAFEDDENEDEDGVVVRHGSPSPAQVSQPPNLRRKSAQSVLPAIVRIRDESAVSVAASSENGGDDMSTSEGDDDFEEVLAPEVAYIADPRYDWSLFEGAEGSATDPIESVTSAPGATLESALGTNSKGLRGFFHRMRPGAKAEDAAAAAAASAASNDASESSHGGLGEASVGMDLQALCHVSITRILEAMLGESTGQPSGGGADDEFDSSDDEDGESGKGSEKASRSRTFKNVAVCPRSRDRASGDASGASAAAAAIAVQTQGGASPAGGTLSMLMSHAFYYVAGRVQMVGVTGPRGRQHQLAAIRAAAAARGAAQTTDTDRELEELMRGAAAVVSIVVRAPVEVQNALACNMQYELGVPQSVVSSVDTAATQFPPVSALKAGMTSSGPAGTPQKPIKTGGLFSAFKRTPKPESPAPKQELSTAALSTSATPSADAVVEAGSVQSADEPYVIIASGSLGPAQSLSLLYGHPDPPVVRLNAGGGVSGGGRSRARYKQRLVAARYVRALSLRLRLPGSSFEWSPWIGLWTSAGSTERTDMVTLQTAAGAGIQVLPPLVLPAGGTPGEPVVSPLRLSDLAGGASTLHVEYALSSPVDLLMRDQSSDNTKSRDGSVVPGRLNSVHTLTLALTIFCRFWLCNATSLPLVYSAAKIDKERGTRSIAVAAGQAQAVLEETFENQRFSMFKWTTRLLPTDRAQWSDRLGTSTAALPRESFVLPSSEWTWADPWVASVEDDTDAEGWQYHLDFPRGTADAGWTGHRTPTHFVRRRRWTRTCLPPSGAAGAGAALIASAQMDMTLAAQLPLTDDSARAVPTDGAGASVDGDVFDDEDVQLVATPTLIPATAATLLALGVFMYGPYDGADEQCAVRVGNESEWSLPWSLRTTVGRPALVSLQSRRKARRDAAASLQPRYDIVISARSCSEAMAEAAHDSAFAASVAHLGGVFRRSLLLTLSPRFIIVNRVDVQGLVEALRGTLGFAAAASEMAIGGIDYVGTYILQIAQAGPHDADGLSRPHPTVTAYLASIATSSGTADATYDVGAALAQRLKLSQLAAHPESGPVEAALVPGLSDLSSSRVSGTATTVPLVQSVPPGEHVPFQWAALADAAVKSDIPPSQCVCFRLVRLARQRQEPTPPPAAVRGGSVRGVAASTTKEAPATIKASGVTTIVVPVTDWSGAIELGQVAEVPLRLRGANGSTSRLLNDGNALSEVVLRVSVRSHRKRGTAMVVVSADAGVRPCGGLLDNMGSMLARRGSQSRRNDDVVSSSVGNHLEPLLWATGVGEVALSEMRVVLAGELAMANARRHTLAADAAAPPPPPPPPPPLFRIDNHTLDTFTVAQKGVLGGAVRPPLVVPPRCSVLFAWDEPEIPAELVTAADAGAGVPQPDGKNGLTALKALLSGGSTQTNLATAAAATAGNGNVTTTQSSSQVQNGLGSGGIVTAANSGGGGVSNGAGAGLGSSESRLRVIVRAVTAPLAGVSTSSSHGGEQHTGVSDARSAVDRANAIAITMDIDLSNVAQTSSLRLAPGRVLDEDTAEQLLGGVSAGAGGGAVVSALVGGGGSGSTETSLSPGLGRSTSGTVTSAWVARPLMYGAPVFVKGRGGASVWALGPLHTSPCLWPMTRLAAGIMTVSPASRGSTTGASSTPAGAPVLSAHCRLADDDSVSSSAAANGSTAAPVVFENVGHWFGWQGLRGSASAATSAALAALRANSDDDGGASPSLTSSDAQGLLQLQQTAVIGVSARYGDLVMVRHDAVVGPAAAAGAASDEASNEESDWDVLNEEEEAVAAARSQPLYLVAHRDGRTDWIQREAALAVALTTTAADAATATSAPPVAAIAAAGASVGARVASMSAADLPNAVFACSVFLIVGGPPGAEVRMWRGRASAGAGSSAPIRSTGAESDSEEESSATVSKAGSAASSSSDAQARRGASSRLGSTGFALLPAAFIDRLLECATVTSSGNSAATLRQCRIPALLTAAGGGDAAGRRPLGAAPTANPADAGDVPVKAGRVVSAMQRKRMLAQGLLPGGSTAGSSTTASLLSGMVSVPVPSSTIPEELLRAGSTGGIKQLRTLLQPGGSTSVPPAARLGRADGARVSLAAADTAGLLAPVDLRYSLLTAVLGLPMLSSSHLPASCVLMAAPLTSLILPARIVAARVGFDGPTRVLTLQANASAAATVTADLHHRRKPSGVLTKKAVPAAPTFANMVSSMSLRVAVTLPRLCVSLVGGGPDDAPEELLLATLDGLFASVENQRPFTTFDLRIQEMQIDNQLPGAAHAVILCRAPPKRGVTVIELEDGASVLIRPFLQASLVHQTHRIAASPAAHTATSGSSGTAAVAAPAESTASASSAVLHIPYASVLLQEVDVALEELLLRRLGGLLATLSGGGKDEDGDEDDDEEGPAGGLLVSANIAQRRGRLGRGISAARDRLAASLLQAASAGGRKKRRSISEIPGSGVAAAARIQERMKNLGLRAKESAAKDMRRAIKAKRTAMRAVRHGAGAVSALLATQAHQIKSSAERARSELQRTLHKMPGSSASSNAAATPSASAMVSISGPAVSSMTAQQRRKAASSAAVSAAATRRKAAQQQKQQAAVRAATEAQVGGDAENALSQSTAGWASAAADSVMLLAADVQWWWPSRLPAADLEQRQASTQLFLQHLLLNPLALNVSFVRDVVVRQRGNGSSSGSGGGGPLGVLLQAVGVMALSLNRAPIRLNGLELVNILAATSDLSARVAQHYISSGLAEVYKVVFSADLLGNPVAVVSALGTGVRDFFVHPAAGLVRSPAAFGRGLGMGSLSLLGNTVAGVGMGVGSLASTLGRGVALLSFDDDYVRARAGRAALAAGRGGPSNIGAGLLAGAKDLGRGLVQGVAGVVLEPMRGAESGGAGGFVRGVGKGLAGLVVKPVAGVLDFAAQTTEGVVASAKSLAGFGHGDGGGAGKARVQSVPRRHQRLAWGIDRCVVAVSPIHAVIVAVLRRALEVEATSTAVSLRDGAGNRSSGVGAKRRQTNRSGAAAGAGGGRRAAPLTSANSSAKGSGGKSASLLADVRALVSGRESALNIALSHVTASYMHHILWPRSPYLLVISTRFVLLARINRSAVLRAGGGGGGSGGGVAHLCWQVPTVTPSALAAAAAATLTAAPEWRSGGYAPAAEHGGIAATSASAIGLFPQRSGDGGRGGGGGQRGGRSGADLATIAGHLAYLHVLDSTEEMVHEASGAIEELRTASSGDASHAAAGGSDSEVAAAALALAAAAGLDDEEEGRAADSDGDDLNEEEEEESDLDERGQESQPAAATAASGPPHALAPPRRVRTGPLPLMSLDALVQARAGRGCGGHGVG